MNFETIALREDDGILHVTLNNPPLNLLSVTMTRELFQLAGALMQRPDIKAVVVDSADPDFFIAHFDLDDLQQSGDDPSREGRYPEINALQSVALNWQNLPQVTIAKVDGRVRGGGLEFILAFDMRFASARSLFCFPEASGHFIASGGGTTRTFFAAGPSRALEFLLSARDFTADEAERYGLINRALAGDALEPYLDDLLGRLRHREREVIAMHRAVFAQLTAPMADTFFAGLAAENDGLRQAFAGRRMSEGIAHHLAVGQTREVELDLPGFIAGMNDAAGGKD